MQAERKKAAPKKRPKARAKAKAKRLKYKGRQAFWGTYLCTTMHCPYDHHAHVPTQTWPRTRRMQVCMPSSYWHCAEGIGDFVGVIGKPAKWRYKKKQMQGHSIKFADGWEKIPFADFIPHIVEMEAVEAA